jgi:hypothetical protein
MRQEKSVESSGDAVETTVGNHHSQTTVEQQLVESDFTARVTQGANAVDVLQRIRWAQEDDDLSLATHNISFKKIVGSLPETDLDRECLQDGRDYLAKRCERARRIAAFTEESSDLKKYVRLKAKVLVIDLVLSAEIQKAIRASLRATST